MDKPRMYNEAKAIRVNTHQNVLWRKLQRSLGNRMKKEKFWEDEIIAINSAHVSISCKWCRKTITLKFSNWKDGKYTRVCPVCKMKHIKQDLQGIITTITPHLPEGYGAFINTTGYNGGSISIIKKETE
jgi:Zn finger protein HypA/HybF involved in hydrogenase expression